MNYKFEVLINNFKIRYFYASITLVLQENFFMIYTYLSFVLHPKHLVYL